MMDETPPREARRLLAFTRRALPQSAPPAPWSWARLTARRNRSSREQRMFSDYYDWADALLVELGAQFSARGWPWTTGPWEFYESDYRIETTVAGARVVLILISVAREGVDGWISSFELPQDPVPDEVSQAVMAVVRDVLERREEVYSLREFTAAREYFQEIRDRQKD